ncbi:hypothetical protein L7F22_060292 [Adiantum nelumboides]|nr:hypothetical protein [Adiantum nelumboides]
MAATLGFTMPPTKQFDLRNGSKLLYFEKFLERKEASNNLESLNNKLPWIRPTLSVHGRKCEQPRQTCYVADEGLPTYSSGSDYAAWHTDDEKIYGCTPTIASVTLGQNK